MTSIAESVATDLAQKLVDGAIKEVNYLCCFKTNVENFEKKKKILAAKRNRVENDIEDAKKRNDNQVEDEIQHWMEETNDLIQEDSKTKKKWFYGWCPNCIWQFQQGKRLSKKMQDITNLIHRCNFDKVARPAELPGIKYYSSQNFIDFESRKSKFKQLVEALEGGNYYKVGLQGMGGTGKTTLAAQVGRKVEESKAFEKVIFAVVSNPPDIKKIRGNIARHLGLPLEEGKEEEHSELLWFRIANNEGKVLIILDDIWEELDLRDIGIPSGHDHRNCCVLITTRDSKVCEAMGCQRTIRLQTLTDKDALNLFLEHVGTRSDDSSREFKDVARDIVEECGGLPLAIVAVATTLKNWHLRDWKNALAILQNSEPLHNVHEDLTKVYRSLKLSYDNLEKRAKDLFLICSLFPEDSEIPTDLLSKLGIALGLFGEVNNYSEVRRRVIPIKNDLVKSSLLLEAEKECVKMHDLVREVALWVADKDIQVIMDSNTTLRANIRFLYWNINHFPNQFDGTKLEILLLLIKGDVLMEVSDAFFVEMVKLRVLVLLCKDDRKYLTPSLSLSFHLLKNIRTLTLYGWELDDLSILRNLQSLETLELGNCLIIELTEEIKKLKKLRLLGLRECKIERNNPFEIIKICSQLEELYFVENYDVEDWKSEDDRENNDKVVQNISPPVLQMYSIACSGLKYFDDDDDDGLLRCFNTEHVKNLISEAMFKYLVGKAEVLELGKIGETGWKNLIPDIVLMKDGGMNNLIKLCLYFLTDIECLIDTSTHLYSDVTVFSKLVELRLYRVDVKELYRGPMPSSFLKQLQILKLTDCKKLHNILFDGKFKLPNLKVLELEHCPMLTSIFQPSSARSLAQLEELRIEECWELKYIVTYESSGEDMVDHDDQRSHGLLFPKLKTLEIERCDKLELISPLLLAGDLPLLEAISIGKCKELKMLPSLKAMELSEVPSFTNIFRECNKCTSSCMQRPSPVSKDDSKEKRPNSTTRAFSWVHECCFLPTTKDTDVEVSKATLQRHTISPELPASTKWVQTFHTAQCLLRQPLNLQNIRDMQLVNCSNLISLFTLSIATTIMLEKLTIWGCHEVKHIITNEGEDHDHINYNSIFPKLEELQIWDCSKLEFIFPSTFSGGLEKLKSINIRKASELKYVFGKYRHPDYLSNENENDELHIHLPALESLCLYDVPMIISICAKNYHLVWPSLQKIALRNCQELRSFSDLMVCSHGRKLNLETVKGSQVNNMPMQNLASLGIGNSEIEVEGVKIERPVTSSESPKYDLSLHNLWELEIIECIKLRAIFSASTLRSLTHLSLLYISNCEELVHIIEEDDENHDHNYSSIFPKLEKLEIWGCSKLESIFPSTFSGGLEKLKSIDITYAPELKYVFGKYHREDYLSNENENDELELHIDLPALENLCLYDVPKIISICDKKYYLTWPCLQNIALWNCQELNIRSFFDLMVCSHGRQLNFEITKELPAQCLFRQPLNLQNIRKMELENCRNLISLFTLSIATTIMLEKLTIGNCHELKHIITYEGEDHDHINYSSIFPKLEKLDIWSCSKLEFIFPSAFSGGLKKLKSIFITDAPELKYVFGKYHPEDYLSNVNENGELHIDLPALETLSLIDVPKIICICAKKYYLTWPSLQKIALVKCQELNIRSFPDLMVCSREGHLNLKAAKAINMRMQNLSEDPKFILILHNLGRLQITGCKKLRAIFSASTLRSLPQLSVLIISNCEELVHVIEEDHGESADDHLHQLCFPKLEEIHIKCCNSLKCLYSISTFGMLPKLQRLEIEEASDLEQVFKCQQDDTQKMVVADVFPNLSFLTLIKLPRLVTFCEGIDFQIVPNRHVVDCPKYRETTQLHEVPENLDSENQVATKELLSTHSNTDQTMPHMGEAKGKQEIETQELASVSPNLVENTKEALKKIIEEVPISEISTMSVMESIPEDTTTMKAKIVTSSIHSQPGDARPAPSTPSFEETGKQVVGIVLASELSLTTTSPNLESTKEAAKEIVEKVPASKTSPMATPFDSKFIKAPTIKETRDASVQEGPKSKKATKEDMLTYSRSCSPDPTRDNSALADVIPSLHRQSQINAAGPSSPRLGICEIFQLVELKDGETALLAQALERYPELRLPREQRTHRIIAFSYRVLVDILILLTTKTPYTITSLEKLTLEANLREATFLGFDKDWVESVRAKVVGMDMSDVLAAEEGILVMDAELETCDVALERVQKQRTEAKERLAVVRRQLEMAQSEFKAIDSQLFGLLEDRKNLVIKITELKEIVSAKDRPFGI